MRYLVMFITAVCLLFLLKLKWPKNKSFFPLLHNAMKNKGRRVRSYILAYMVVRV